MGSFPLNKKEKLSKVVRINFHGVKINFYGGKTRFQEEHALLQAIPNFLKPPIIGPSVMAGLHLSKLIKFHKSRSGVAT